MSDQFLASSPISTTVLSDQEKERSDSFIDRGSPLPESYGETRIVLLPRDPHCMFSYWEITEETIGQIQSRYGKDIFKNAQTVVRMVQTSSSRAGDSPLRHQDVPVILDTKNWYLNTEHAGSSWYVELGLKNKKGEFILIAKSNLITLPNSKVSEVTDEKWMVIKEDLEKIMEASGGGHVGTGSLELAKTLARRWETLIQTSSQGSHVGPSLNALISRRSQK